MEDTTWRQRYWKRLAAAAAAGILAIGPSLAGAGSAGPEVIGDTPGEPQVLHFDEDLDSSTITDSNIWVREISTETAISSSVTLSGSSDVHVDAPGAVEGVHEIYISTGVEDTAGRPVPAPIEWPIA